MEKLHQSNSFIPELSLVAKTERGEIIGYILLTEVKIQSQNGSVKSLSVAPLAVHPQYQHCGVGGALLHTAHEKAAKLGYETAVLIGHKDYYPRFGYRQAIDYDITFPFDVPPQYCMVKELIPHKLSKTKWKLLYPDIFFENINPK